jgi:hypothetical protein
VLGGSGIETHRVGAGAFGVLVMLLALFLAGCAGELPDPRQSTTIPFGGGATVMTESLGVELGDQIAATWSQGIQKLVPLLEGTPPAASLQSPVSQLKEEHVQKMVALGRKVETLDQAGKEEAWDRATATLESTAGSDWFQSYVRLYDQYAAANDQTSQEFAILLSTFNTLTQYAFFDLLKEQDPEEAQRLGIE